MSNTTKGLDISGEIKNGKPQIREFNHKALPDDKQEIFTANVIAFLSKVDELDPKFDEAMKLV